MSDDFRPGQVMTIFRSRLCPDANPEYSETAEELSGLARSIPGYVQHKVFTADDGERVTVVTFETPEAHAVWRDHARHREAKATGRDHFYEEYSIQVGTCTVAHQFSRPTRQ